MQVLTRKLLEDSRGWIGVDLDGTLAHYDHWRGETHIGAPIPEMLERVKRWLEEGREVRIVTARASRIPALPEERRSYSWRAAVAAIEAWSLEHVGRVLPVTCEKDYLMLELWDDRAVTVEANTGRPLARSTRGLEP
jgi:hypothetical protein